MIGAFKPPIIRLSRLLGVCESVIEFVLEPKNIVKIHPQINEVINKLIKNLLVFMEAKRQI